MSWQVTISIETIGNKYQEIAKKAYRGTRVKIIAKKKGMYSQQGETLSTDMTIDQHADEIELGKTLEYLTAIFSSFFQSFQ